MKKLSYVLLAFCFLVGLSGYASATIISFNNPMAWQTPQHTLNAYQDIGVDVLVAAKGAYAIRSTMKHLRAVNQVDVGVTKNLLNGLTYYLTQPPLADALPPDPPTDFLVISTDEVNNGETAYPGQNDSSEEPTEGSQNPVPEPATLLLLGTGILGLSLKMRRRKER